MRALWFVAITACVFGTDPAFAQYRYRVAPAPQYYQPRVYQPPQPYYSRDAYIAGGTIVGGTVGTRYGGPYGGVVGGAVGGYYGGTVYDQQAAPRYYYPRAYGVQTTTPY